MTAQHLQALFETAMNCLKANDVLITEPVFYEIINTGFTYYPNNCASLPDYEIAQFLRQAVDEAFAGISLSSKVFMPSKYTVRAHLDYIHGTLIFNFDVPKENVKIVYVNSE